MNSKTIAMRRMKTAGAARNLVLALVAFSMFSSCGGDDPKSRPDPGHVSGIVVKGPVSGATIAVTEFAVGNPSPRVFGATTSTATGTFLLSVKSASGPVLIIATDGSYTDEATAVLTPMTGVSLGTALPSFTRGEELTGIAVTPLTTIAMSMALADAANNSTAYATAITRANTAIAAYFGLTDIVGTLPDDLTAGAAAAGTQSALYGAILAGISQEASTLGVSAHDLTDALAIDAMDGIFDGLDGGTPIDIGGGPALPADAAQASLATEITAFLNSARNVSGLTAADFNALTTGIAARSNDIVALASIAVTPANPFVQIGSTRQFTATGTFSDGSTQDLTTSVTWDSSDTNAATINIASGLADAVATGAPTITATDASSSISGSTTINVVVQVFSYASDITPILLGSCGGGGCHRGGFTSGGLSVDTYALLMAGGASGSTVVAGNPDGSMIIKRLEGTVGPQMPDLSPPLDAATIQIIRDWITQGALNN